MDLQFGYTKPNYVGVDHTRIQHPTSSSLWYGNLNPNYSLPSGYESMGGMLCNLYAQSAYGSSAHVEGAY
jgi:hypothetical protein